MYNYLVVDAESNGLYGRSFTIAACWVVNGNIQEQYIARCPIEGPVHPWVAQHVLPAISDEPITHSSYDHMLGSFRAFCAQKVRHRSRVLTFIQYPVETNLFRDIYGAREDTWFDGPFPMLDLSSILHDHNEDDTSLEQYMDKYSLVRPPGRQHHPMYDAQSTWTVFSHLKGVPS